MRKIDKRENLFYIFVTVSNNPSCINKNGDTSLKLILILFIFLSLPAFAQSPGELIPKAKLIFEDDFNRTESDDSKEELGNNWKTNSAKRAQGIKQADLNDGVLHIKMAKEADHGVSVLHTNPFDDGIVTVKFKMLTSKGMKFNYNDPKAKKVTWAGHICAVGVTPNSVQIVDQIEGYFRLDIHNMRKAGKKKEAAALCKDKAITRKAKLEIGKWYEMTMVFKDSTLTAYIDGQEIAKLDSKGLDHLKDNIAFAVNGEVEVDNLKVYSLD